MVKYALECYLIKITSYSDIDDCKMFMISGKEELARYICTICPDDREMPGFEGVVAKWDRNKHGESNRDCLILERGLVIPGDTF